MQKTLKLIWLTFLIPMTIGLMLAYFGYRGITNNQGTWLNPPIPLSQYMETLPENNQYRWTVLYPCQSCTQATPLQNAIQTLGTKASFVNIITEPPFKQYDESVFYLVDPHQNIVMQYDATEPLKVAKDLKRILKSVSQ